MTERPKRQVEGRHKPEGEEAPLYVLAIVAALLVLIGYFFQTDSSQALVAYASTSGTTTTSTLDNTGDGSTTTATASVVFTHPVRDPVRIIIPAIEVDERIVPVGLLQNGDMETPPSGVAGWYSLGPAPGDPGPAVVLGHVDSTRGPDVFYRLKELQPGDTVYVYGSDGADPAVFLVDHVETQLKSELPRERIWLYAKEPLIRLITCGGKYSRKWGHYLSNVIVYGHLVR